VDISRAHCKHRVISFLVVFLVALAVLLIAGCTTAQPDTVTAFSTGVGQVRTQAQTALSDANKLARQTSINYVVASTQPGLTEDKFLVAVEPSDIEKWDDAFAGLQAYASGLQTLLSPQKSQDFGTAAVDLGEELKEGHANTSLPPGVAAAFTQLGEILIQAEQQRDALAAMRKADPAVRAALTSMANAIGNDPRSQTTIHGSGLMGTVYANWATLLDQPRSDFAHATEAKDLDKKRTAVSAYLDVIDKRDAELDALVSLKQSLMSLADAHSAASRGSKEDVAGVIALISQQLDETKSLFQKFSDIQKEK
jgi:hypothetical protein